MKKLTTIFIYISRNIILLVLLVIALSISSCKKEASLGKRATIPALDAKAKSAKLKESTAKVLKDFVIHFNNNQTSGSSGSGGNYSGVSANYTTYTTASSTIYTWSDVSTGTTYTMTQSNTPGVGGLGQLSYNGKNFDYGFVLSIKVTAGDTTSSWGSLFGGGGNDLRGLVAIDGDLTSTDFTIRNLAFFMVMTSGGSGTYKFIDWYNASIGNSDGFGCLWDFSDVVNNTTSGLNDPNIHIVVTSGGHVTVSDQSFDMNNDAKVMDKDTHIEYSLSGTVMLL